MMNQPVVDAGENRGRAVLSCNQSGSGFASADIGLDGIEIADEGYPLVGNRRGSGAGDLEQLSARMRPAIGKLDARTDPVSCNEAVVSGIAVDLQDAAEALNIRSACCPPRPEA